jgi:transcriptional regulator with XRE-family HTH domain
MSYKIDFTLASSSQIEAALCSRVERIRLSRNMTQERLARESGVSTRTIGRLEKGQGVSLDTFIRVMQALRIQQNLETLLPDPVVRPMERIGVPSGERKRARPKPSGGGENAEWTWGDEKP